MGWAALGAVLVGAMKAAVVGALVGAVVGGITAAITGGNIFKGVLYGAVGGAVTGALAYGVGAVMNGISTAATTTTSGAGQVSSSAGHSLNAAENAYLSAGTAEAAKSTTQTTFIGKLGESLKSGWSSIKEGVSGLAGEGALEGAMAKGAVSSGITAAGNMYMKNKELKAAEKMQDKAHQQNLEMIDKKGEWEAKIAGMSGGGGGGGGLSVEDQLAIVKAQSEGAIAKTKAEIQGQKELKEQEYAKQDELQKAASDAGMSLSTGAGSYASKSTESLVDIQNRIREGENQDNKPNAGYIVPVQYALQGA